MQICKLFYFQDLKPLNITRCFFWKVEKLKFSIWIEVRELSLLKKKVYLLSILDQDTLETIHYKKKTVIFQIFETWKHLEINFPAVSGSDIDMDY